MKRHAEGPRDNGSEAASRRIAAGDWLASVDDLVALLGREGAGQVLQQVRRRAAKLGVHAEERPCSPYLNSIHADEQPPFPGDAALEERLEAWSRWNAAAMVVSANRRQPGIGGHLSTYASAATLLETGFDGFFRGRDHRDGGDQVFFQGHASPGVYARAYLERRLDERALANFRRELQPGGGLPSYPHPWLMPGFWEFPTVSMGLGAISAVYQARFNRYLEARGLARRTGRVWAMLGDGEMDEPESVGALTLAARERLDNLIFVINCNLQRLDGPVRGSGKVIQELESLFLGAGWKVIKVVWGSAWDPLLAADRDGVLVARMTEAVDGDYQRYAAAGATHLREHFFGASEELRRMIEGYDDAAIERLHFGGHDRRKVWAAYRAAEAEPDRPTVVLAKTVKGFGLGPDVEGRNVTHKATVLDGDELRALRDRLDLPIGDAAAEAARFCRPGDSAPEMRYLRERREALGGPVPRRRDQHPAFAPPSGDAFARHLGGSGERDATTTACLVRLLGDLLRDRELGPRIVPIVPDEARTFGMEALFPRIGIYAAGEPRYEPVDAETVLAYREAPDGQLLEEGITEAGAMASTIAAGTARATHGVPMVPFFFFYSMFGFQRVGDLIWAAQDARARGFLIGATAGRTTLNGEGLQHQDGHSQLFALAQPQVRAFDPAFGYEVTLIVRHGLRRMLEQDADELFYLTVYNEPDVHPPMPEGCEEGVLRGLYRLREPISGRGEPVPLLASGTMVRQALRAQELLAEELDVAASVWSVTSWTELHRDAALAERWCRLHPGAQPSEPWLHAMLGPDPGPLVAVSDYVKALPCALGAWLGDGAVVLGTDGFGRSEGRAELRRFFEVDAEHIALAAVTALARAGRFPRERLARVMQDLAIDADQPNPAWC